MMAAVSMLRQLVEEAFLEGFEKSMVLRATTALSELDRAVPHAWRESVARRKLDAMRGKGAKGGGSRMVGESMRDQEADNEV